MLLCSFTPLTAALSVKNSGLFTLKQPEDSIEHKTCSSPRSIWRLMTSLMRTISSITLHLDTTLRIASTDHITMTVDSPWKRSCSLCKESAKCPSPTLAARMSYDLNLTTHIITSKADSQEASSPSPLSSKALADLAG